ncbi:MAG: shikimate kinase [Gemmatimonadetes bacterium]|nr:shikimate kinase [Gemmatimonadota bacterium]MBT8402898.1 shikimate kinase [Gemmatimonadota bacterium]NNF37609.1 shikimate kinase [Gemmatimonadota bacterium]
MDGVRGSEVRRILLIGFMASGKTTVGRAVAQRLGWEFLDFDAEIERRVGTSVAEIFAARGEAAFREHEARIGNELLARHRVVLASGGGWPMVPGRMEALDAATLSVWLQVDVATALERAARDGDTRPLLRGPDPESAVRALLAAREPSYARARLHLDASSATAEDLARAIARFAAVPPTG